MPKKQEKIDIGGDFSKMEKQIEAGFDGKIRSIRLGASSEFFGEEQKYENRIGYILTVDVFMTEDDGSSVKCDEFETFMNKPKPQFLKQSKLGAYKEQYGKFPDVNDEVKVIVDDNGFYQIEGVEVDIEEE